MEANQPRPMPIHAIFPRLKDNGSLVNEQEVKTVMAQWVKAHAFPYVNLHINEAALERQAASGRTINVPGFMIVGYVSTTEEKVLPQTRDLALRLCATFDSKEAHIMFGAYREQVTRPIPQQPLSGRAARELILSLSPQPTLPIHTRKLN